MIERKITDSKVLVTGVAGFIGSNLAADLLANGNQVVGLDSFITGKKQNLGSLIADPNFTFIEGDIRSKETCDHACSGIDYVLHQAALGSVPRSIEDPFRTNDININGFLTMLIAARDAKVKRFVYATSSSVYGTEKRLPKVEEKIGDPLSPYAITKSVNEQYAKVFGQLYDIETIGLRYFNVFGAQQDPDGEYAAAIPKFIRQFVRHESPIIHGDGTQSRDFTYIDNVIQANNLAAISTNPDAHNEVFNVAFGESTNLDELVQLLQELLSAFDPQIANIEIKYGPERVGDVRHSLASIVKSTTLLGYKPEQDLRSGLEKAIAWYWENLH
ncbi:SDR family oxidoreductase [Salibacteraceae bacterium]|nr:SDR family oxidoreductase [Salibacteraceae bacterium]